MPRRKPAESVVPPLAVFVPRHRKGSRISRATRGEARMDLLYIALAAGFFGPSWAFIVACDRLSSAHDAVRNRRQHHPRALRLSLRRAAQAGVVLMAFGLLQIGLYLV